MEQYKFEEFGILSKSAYYLQRALGIIHPTAWRNQCLIFSGHKSEESTYLNDKSPKVKYVSATSLVKGSILVYYKYGAMRLIQVISSPVLVGSSITFDSLNLGKIIFSPSSYSKRTFYKAIPYNLREHLLALGSEIIPFDYLIPIIDYA